LKKLNQYCANYQKQIAAYLELSKTNSRISGTFEMLGLSKSGFYNMTSPKGNPEFVTILRLLNLFDIKLTAEARK